MAQDDALSQQIRRDYRKASVSAADRVMLEYAEKLVKDRWAVTADDHVRLRSAGFSNADIFDITLVVANFMLANTLTDALGLEYHENLHHVFVQADASDAAVEAATSDLERVLPGDEVWLHGAPIDMKTLLGRPVLVYYWDWTHPGSLDGLPVLATWHERWARDGLAVLLLLAPEFPFAKEAGAASAAVRRLGVTLPVALVPSYRTWRGANNTFWPALHLFDRGGRLRARQHGPAGVEMMGRALVRLLGHEDAGARSQDLAPETPAARAGPAETTLPLYAIHEKGRLAHPEAAGAEGRIVDFSEPDAKIAGMLYLAGRWRIRPEALELAGGAGAVSVRYRGAGVAAVLGCQGQPAAAAVLLNGETPGDASGRHLHDGRIAVAEPGLYELVRAPFDEYDLRLESDTPGFTVYALTFLAQPHASVPADVVADRAAAMIE